MKNLFVYSLLFLFAVLVLLSAGDTKTLTVKGFYLGMEKNEVKKLYDAFEKDKIAKFISIERENYRDQIKLDNEFGGMGNKIDIMYDEKFKAKSIHFYYKTVDILFDASKLKAEELTEKIRKEYKLPEMEYKYVGFGKGWVHTDKKSGFKLTIDDDKNLKIQKIKK